MHPALLLSPTLRRQFDEATARRLDARRGEDGDVPAHQLRAFQQTWADAIADVPYYAALVASGQAPATIRQWDQLDGIPVLTRRIVQDRSAEFIRRSGPPAGYVKTAGSTGTPLRVGMHQPERDRMRVVKLAAWQALGYERSSRLFLIWGHAHLLGTGWRGRINHLKRRLSDAALGYRRVDAYRLSRRSCAAHAEDLIRFRPIGLIGYASALDLFARYTQPFRPRFRELGMRFVLSTAEAPPRPDTIPLLEDLFGCPVVQEYGGAEFGQVAFKQGSEPFEVYSDLNYLECLPSDSGAPAEPALLTTLYPRYLPLIRYCVGDELVAPERLLHGHVHRFRAVAGRINDVIKLEDGDSIHSVAILHCIHQEAHVHAIQMVLTDDGIKVCLVSTGGDRAAMEKRILRRLTQVHPSLGQVRFEYVEDLRTNRAGKRRWYVDLRTTTPCVESPAS